MTHHASLHAAADRLVQARAKFEIAENGFRAGTIDANVLAGLREHYQQAYQQVKNQLAQAVEAEKRRL